MSDERGVNRCCIRDRAWIAWVVLIVVIMVAGIWFIVTLTSMKLTPKASWDGERVSIVSGDGPWMLIHLVVYRADGYRRAVAQLPEPVTIIESGALYFSREEINSLPWLGIDGKGQEPPGVGEAIGVMYVVPKEGKHPPLR